jgi:hypothetical protein
VDYSKDGPFNDPVVRCDKCSKILLLEKIRQDGTCPYCGSRRIRNLLAFDDEEAAQMKAWNIPEEFMKIFEGRPEA